MIIFEETEFDTLELDGKTLVTAPNGAKAEFYGEQATWFAAFKYWAIKQVHYT